MELKRMRFNLRFPDPRGDDNFVTVHSVKELRDCLMDSKIAFDDLIDYFRKGQLHRWFECMDAEEMSRGAKIRKLFEDGRGKPVADFAVALLAALDMEVDKAVVDAFVRDYVLSPVKMLQDKRVARKDLEVFNTQVANVCEGFRKDKLRLLEMKKDMKALRKYVAQMLKIYGGLSNLEEFHFIEFLKKDCPLGALVLLTLPEGQKYKDDSPDVFKRFVVVKHLNNEPTLFLNENLKLEKNHSYLLSGDDAPIKVYRNATKRREWDSIVPAGKKVLLLWNCEYIVSDVGAKNESDWFYSAKLNGRYQIFNGLEVWSESARSVFQQPFLAYMEVPNDGE